MFSLHKIVSTFSLLMIASCGGKNPVTEAIDAREKVDCGNGNITFVYKNPERFFPEYVKDYDASVAMNQQLIKELGSISVSFKDSTVRMMNELDQENARFRMSLKAAFVDMNMHPCSNEAEQNFRTLSTRLTDFNFRINEINKDVAEAKVILSTPDTKSLPDTIQPVVDDAKKSLGKDSVNIKAIKIYQQNQVLRNFGNTINEMKLHNIRIKPR